MAAPRTRMTRQRSEILAALHKVKNHPTAEEIHALVRCILPRISLGTVYRNLDLLVRSGEIRELDSPGPGRRFDGDVSQHLHIRCLRCGSIADVDGPVHSPDLNGLNAKGFVILGQRIELEGLCEHCVQTFPDFVPHAYSKKPSFRS